MESVELEPCNNSRAAEHKYNTHWLKHQPVQKVMKWRRECKSQLLRGAFFWRCTVTCTAMSSLCNTFPSVYQTCWDYPDSINMMNCSKIVVTLTNELKTPENLLRLVYSYPNLDGPAGLGQSVSHTHTNTHPRPVSSCGNSWRTDNNIRFHLRQRGCLWKPLDRLREILLFLLWLC